MTQDEIIEMARQAGFVDWENSAYRNELQAFAKLVAAKERERITAMLMYLHNQTSAYHNYYKHAAIEINRKDGEGELI